MSESLDAVKEKLKQFPKESKQLLKDLFSEYRSNGSIDILSSKIDMLSDEEYSVFLDILKETSADGFSKTYQNLRYEDYEEIPVDIKTFICDKDYLGVSTDGGRLIYPYWMNMFEKIFAPDSTTLEVILTGAIGIGKSNTAVIGMAYILYKLLCLKNPARYYNLVEGSKIALAIFNIDLQHVEGIGYAKLQGLLKRSPWFIRHGVLRGRTALAVTNRVLNGDPVTQDQLDDLTYEPGKDISILIGSKVSHFTGYDVFCAFLDEMNFYEKGRKNQESAETFTSSEIMKVYTAIKRRIESRFMIQGVVPGLIFMISSKRAENDALELYAERSKQDKTVYIVDEPQWVVKNLPGIYSGATFKLLVGNKFSKTKLITPGEDLQAYIESGRKILDVPIELKRAFELDADQALTDIAGVALVSGQKFFDANKYISYISGTRKNIFLADTIMVGLHLNNSITPFINLQRIPTELKHLPIFIHIDTSKNHDRTGIGIVCRTTEYVDIERYQQGEITQVRDYKYVVLGATGISAPPGDEVSYRQIVNLMVYLRSAGLNIARITMDTYQSVFLRQELVQNSFTADVLSLDRTPAAYLAMRTALAEGRIDTIANEILTHEITELIENKQTGKIDHPLNGSKDISDGVAGAYYSASMTLPNAMSAHELAQSQEMMLDAQLEPVGFNTIFGHRVINKNDDIFAEIDAALDDDDGIW